MRDLTIKNAFDFLSTLVEFRIYVNDVSGNRLDTFFSVDSLEDFLSSNMDKNLSLKIHKKSGNAWRFTEAFFIEKIDKPMPILSATKNTSQVELNGVNNFVTEFLQEKIKDQKLDYTEKISELKAENRDYKKEIKDLKNLTESQSLELRTKDADHLLELKAKDSAYGGSFNGFLDKVTANHSLQDNIFKLAGQIITKGNNPPINDNVAEEKATPLFGPENDEEKIDNNTLDIVKKYLGGVDEEEVRSFHFLTLQLANNKGLLDHILNSMKKLKQA